jgi:hypothetical protein
VTSAMDNGGESSDTASRSSSESSFVASSPPSPHLTSSSPSSARSKLDALSLGHHRSNSSPSLQVPSQSSHLPREKQRVTLRAFLRQIIRDKRLVRSHHLVDFLLQAPIQKMSREEELDIHRRLEMDRLRLDEQRKFVEESRKRAKELEQWLRGFKSDLIRHRIAPQET